MFSTFRHFPSFRFSLMKSSHYPWQGFFCIPASGTNANIELRWLWKTNFVFNSYKSYFICSETQKALVYNELGCCILVKHQTRGCQHYLLNLILLLIHIKVLKCKHRKVTGIRSTEGQKISSYNKFQSQYIQTKTLLKTETKHRKNCECCPVSQLIVR